MRNDITFEYENMNLKGFCVHHELGFDRRLTEKERLRPLEHHGKVIKLIDNSLEKPVTL
jgi:hypothetical protein